MNRIIFLLIVVVAVIIGIHCDNETPAEQCPGLSFENLRERIEVNPCGKSKCKLRKGTNITIILKFKPKYEIIELSYDVFANIAGVHLPFVGVTGTNACDHVTRADDGKPVTCPLAAGQEYVNTNVIHVEELYPQTDLRVHWGIKDDKEDVMCFEVPAVILK